VSNVALRADIPAWGDGVLDVMVEGPEGSHLTDADLRRLFPGSALTDERLNRLSNWPRLVVRVDDVPVALATYTQHEGETQIPDFALDVPARANADGSLRRRALEALIDAVQVASLAGACRRIVLIPPPDAVSMLERRGFSAINEGCAGAWMEKSLT
jgi:hypothetical protein